MPKRSHSDAAQNCDPDQIDQLRLEAAVESVVDPRYPGSDDQQQNTNVVESEIESQGQFTGPGIESSKALLVEELSDSFRMAMDRMKRERHSQAGDRTEEERTEDQLLFPLYFVNGPSQVVDGDGDQYDASDHMRPNNNRLRVHSKNRLETFPIRRCRRTMTSVQMLVVFEPVGQMADVQVFQRRIDNLKLRLFRIKMRSRSSLLTFKANFCADCLAVPKDGRKCEIVFFRGRLTHS